MKITYRKEMKHNYLIVDPESLTWRNYECRMLAANFIEGAVSYTHLAIDILVHLGRLRDKSRRVLEIVEVGAYVDGEIQLNPLYRFVEEAGDEPALKEAGDGGKKIPEEGARKNEKQSNGEKNGFRREERVRGRLVRVGELQAVEKLRSAGYPV